jgi:cholesterol transport system auxiliary component
MTAAGLACPLLLGLVASCALLSRGQPLAISYYEPEALPTERAPTPSPGCSLDLGRVVATNALREQIQVRISPHQAGYYDDRLWTELPDEYLRRALERRLFESQRCSRTLSEGGPVLDATLLSFSELRSPEAARVSVQVLLHDGARVLIDTTVEAELRAAPNAGFDAVVRAMSEALEDVVARVSQQVEQSLRAVAVR